MKKAGNESESNVEETVSYKNFIKGLERTRSFTHSGQGGIIKRAGSGLINNKLTKKTDTAPNKKFLSVDSDSVGEEGTAQIIRSPIVKRGKSSHSSVDLTCSNHLLETERNFKLVHDQLQGAKIESYGLKQENVLLKSHIRLLQSSICDLQKKLDLALIDCQSLNEKFAELTRENRKLNLENEKLAGMVLMLENDSFRSSKAYLQDDLEAKILSLDKEKEEKNEQYQQILLKFVSYLHEFMASEEWILSLIHSPYMVKEIEDSAELVKTRYERIKEEINSCQSEIVAQRFIENSYFTSVSSSILPSPIYSPSRTLRFAYINELTGSYNLENNN